MEYVDNFDDCKSFECDARKMALGLHDRFGVGKAGCNDGVLLLFAIKNR